MGTAAWTARLALTEPTRHCRVDCTDCANCADCALPLRLRLLRATAWIVLDVLLRATAWSALIALTVLAAWLARLRKPRNLLFALIKTEYGKKSHWQ